MNKGGSTPSIPNPWAFKIGVNGAIDADLDNIHIAEIAPINTTSKVDSDSKLGLKVEPLDLKIEPLKVDSNSVTASSIDLKPVAVDSCQTIKIAPLPPMRMEQPYSQHFGITFMGVELFGFTSSGKYDTLLNDPPHAGSCCGQHVHAERASTSGRPEPTVARNDNGLRVRIGK
ncbi:MAG: hypothetical protein J0H27_00375 [Xanthomonadales bacterium]|nr:hypothetical protein [Xanthomonadales bacterium]ODU93914.1 MAG: hypothetical protein ABT18_06070 [Rhodanobacter sp. SCN 66-43]OJY82621.1 MAG: hypothetical protein BGP23_05680 [Xanthomonadales bacterium 66-474]